MTVGQCDDNDQWYVLRGDIVIAGPFGTKEAAIAWRDYREFYGWPS
jgi:hypothetical protein